ncbi:Protein kinase domain-containing protein [Pleurotus pulmonarius]
MDSLAIPKAPSIQLKRQCFRIFSLLQFIPELASWVEDACACQHAVPKRDTSLYAYHVVWQLISCAAPLGILLDILGSLPSGSHYPLGADPLALFESFIERVRLFELEGKLPFGEVIRLEDLLGCSCTGFSRILRTVDRVLLALQASFPGLYVLQKPQPRLHLLQELFSSEHAHLSVVDSTIEGKPLPWNQQTSEWTASFECLLVNLSRFSVYHHNVINKLEETLSQGTSPQQWDEIFATNTTLYTKVAAAYRSCCSDYLNICKQLEDRTAEQDIDHVKHALSIILSRISNYVIFLQEIIFTTNPSEFPSEFDSLCSTTFEFVLLSDDLYELGASARTSLAASKLRKCAYKWNSVDPRDLGILLLDDHLCTGSSGEQLSVFLFEKMLLCCSQASDQEGTQEELVVFDSYPIADWEIGPALRSNTLLNMVHAIPTEHISALRCFEHDSFELDWHDGHGGRTKGLIFCRLSQEQCDQWCETLRPFTTRYYRSPDLDAGCGHCISLSSPLPVHHQNQVVVGRSARPRSWSVIGRKGPRSDTSSFQQEKTEYLLSPNLLPRLFSISSDGLLSPRSNKSSSKSERYVSRALVQDMRATATVTQDKRESLGSKPPPDLTGQITKEAAYPSAGGGFADVWKGTWNVGDGSQDKIKVAVKVLRSRIEDVDREERMKRLFHRELNLWQKLDHKNIIPLLGTASDFGHYSAMVCPWYEYGSVSKYLEKYGDILSMTDRIRLLCQVASGLSYLHSFGIVHGDLTGSNILINDEGDACLCDFGLSSIASEFQDSPTTLGVAGSVRWADARLTLAAFSDGETLSVTTCNDIYSFGSVMLEILSGRIPYHYIRADAQVVIELHKGNKPRRPSDSFVTSAQWQFIQRCWGDEFDERPRIEEVCVAMKEFHRHCLEHRRYTA